ncbi:MAG: hypothetical protein GY928_38620 [Colwellia sp.]|nr:hypothetical protein [Colwellia sp.]
MAFKIQPFYNIDSTPIYSVSMEDGVLGMANKNGTILLNKDLPAHKMQEVIDHEMTHLEDMKDYRESGGKKGLHYENDKVMYDGKTYARKDGKILYNGKWQKEGWKGFEWERKAYNS